MPATLTLPTLLARAGAVMTPREGSTVAAHYGSAAAELAVCARGVGLAVRSDLSCLELTAPADALTRLSERVAEHALAPGGVAQIGSVWWCRSPAGDAIEVICRRLTAARVIRTLRGELGRIAHATLTDRSDTHVLLNLVGPSSAAVLAAAGLVGSGAARHPLAPFTHARLGTRGIGLLAQSPSDVLIVVGKAEGAPVWQALMEAGRASGIACIGIEAIDRHRLRERALGHSLVLL